MRFANNGAYGTGNYFAIQASYSASGGYVHTRKDGTRSLFFANVLIGDPANNVDPSRNKPPLKNPGNAAIIHNPNPIGFMGGIVNPPPMGGFNPPPLGGFNPPPLGGFNPFPVPLSGVAMNPAHPHLHMKKPHRPHRPNPRHGGMFGMPNPNPGPGSDIRYDSVTDGSSMYIVYSNQKAYPQYYVVFK